MKTDCEVDESFPHRMYRQIYEAICGKHPAPRPWHFQWLATYYLCCHFRELLPTFGGRILDVGCGGKPYRNWFGTVTDYVGLDITQGSSVDVVVSDCERWPLQDEYFDVLFSSQVLEHVEFLQLTLQEMERVLKKGGSAVLAFPFLYNEHGGPQDYRRFTMNGAVKLFPGLEIVRAEKLGGIGSTLGLLLLNWINNSRILKVLVLPVWIPLSFVVNGLGFLLDRIDRTGSFYNNILLVVKKKAET